jgi:hypothetical protein
MSRRFGPIAFLVPLVFLSLASLGATLAPGPTSSYTVHEWGTFTSIAGQDGRAQEWVPLNAPEDLPCFVERYDPWLKGRQFGTVRMETPVVYFYGADDLSVDVKVKFKDGTITEWYPHANVTPRIITYGMIEHPGLTTSATWSGVHITPQAPVETFPTEAGRSHYYLARETDAIPVHVGTQREKFLFYRGIGIFQPPISAKVGDAGTIAVKSPAGEPLGDLILFENRGGKMTFKVQHVAATEATLTPPALGNGTTPPTAELQKILIAHGLFPREAKAMVDTWRDSWFEEGARLFYIASRQTIDDRLPMQLTPMPKQIERAFVGRMELVTARTEQDLTAAINARDTPTLAKYGRFLQPIVTQLVAKDRATHPLTVTRAGLDRPTQTQLEHAAYAAIEPVLNAQANGHKPCPQPLLEQHTTQR